MPPLSGFLATLPADVLLDSGVLFINSDTPFGVSRGGLAFDPGTTYENIDFDDKRYPIQGLDRKEGGTPKISGTIIELSVARLLQLEPASTQSGASADITITPKIAGELLAVGDYLTNVRVAYRRGSGKFAILKFTHALVTKYSTKGNPKGQVEVAIEIEARNNTDTGAPPYEIHLADSAADSPLRALTDAIGALGVWPLSEGAGGYAYNAAGPQAALDNIVGGPERSFSSAFGENPWSNAFVVGITDDFANNRNGVQVASRFQMNAAAGGYLLQSVASLPAGTYTMSLDVASNTGLAQTFRMSHDNTATFSGDFAIPGAGWTRFSYTFVHAGGTANLAFVTAGAGGAALDILIYGAKLNLGAAVTAYVAPSFDLELGRVGIYDAADMPTWNAGGWLAMQGTKSATAIRDLNAVVAQLSVYALARWTGVPVLAGSSPLLSEHFNAGAGNLFWFDMGDTANNGHGPRLQIGATPSKDAYCMKPSDGAWHIFAATYDGTNFNLYCDDCLMATKNAPGLAAITIRQILLGNFNQAAFWPGDIALAAIYSSGHSGATVASIGAAMRELAVARGIAITKLSKLVVWEGDSISDVGSGLGFYPRIAALASIKGAQGYNPAVSGSTIADLNTRAAAIDALYDATRAKNVLHVLIGANDSGIMGAAYWTGSIKPYLAARRAVGWKVVVATVLPRTLAGYNANRNACNAAIIADPTAYDGISRFDLVAGVGADGDAAGANYSDGEHPNLGGHVLLAPTAQAAVDALL